MGQKKGCQASCSNSTKVFQVALRVIHRAPEDGRRLSQEVIIHNESNGMLVFHDFSVSLCFHREIFGRYDQGACPETLLNK